MEDKKNNNEAKDGKGIFSLPGVTEKRLAGILKKLKEGTDPSDLWKAEKKVYNSFSNEISEYMKTSSSEDIDNIVFSIDDVNQSDLDNLVAEAASTGVVSEKYREIYNKHMDVIDSHIDLLKEDVDEEISDAEHDVIAAGKNADADGRDDSEKDDLKKSKKGLFHKGMSFLKKHLVEKTEQEKLDKIERDKNKGLKKSKKTTTNSKNLDKDESISLLSEVVEKENQHEVENNEQKKRALEIAERLAELDAEIAIIDTYIEKTTQERDDFRSIITLIEAELRRREDEERQEQRELEYEQDQINEKEHQKYIADRACKDSECIEGNTCRSCEIKEEIRHNDGMAEYWYKKSIILSEEDPEDERRHQDFLDSQQIDDGDEEYFEDKEKSKTVEDLDVDTGLAIGKPEKPEVITTMSQAAASIGRLLNNDTSVENINRVKNNIENGRYTETEKEYLHTVLARMEIISKDRDNYNPEDILNDIEGSVSSLNEKEIQNIVNENLKQILENPKVKERKPEVKSLEIKSAGDKLLFNGEIFIGKTGIPFAGKANIKISGEFINKGNNIEFINKGITSDKKLVNAFAGTLLKSHLDKIVPAIQKALEKNEGKEIISMHIENGELKLETK